ncbi:MAG: hypothetical protein ACK41D_06155 [Rubricoccaceae bacterium]
MDGRYTPVACGLYDVLEVAALRGATIPVAYFTVRGETVQEETTIADLFTRGCEEYARLGSGADVRLDRLLRVGAVVFGEAPAGARPAAPGAAVRGEGAKTIWKTA